MSSLNTDKQQLTVIGERRLGMTASGLLNLSTSTIPYKYLHMLIHQLEAHLAQKMNQSSNQKEIEALEHAYDHLVHQVAEYIRTAEKRS